VIIPCIDLMDGKVVQLVQGRKKALEGGTLDEMLEKFDPFPEIQVIDLDAAMGRGSNDRLVAYLAEHASIRAGGGIRTPERAATLVGQGARKVIVGTAAFTSDGVNTAFLRDLAERVGRERIIIALDSREGRIVVKGWRESTNLSAEDVIRQLEPYCSGFLCTYVDKEGMLQGTDLTWFRRLRKLTGHEITAAGGISSIAEICELQKLDIHAAVGMAVYTGRLDLQELVAL
jgi:phosphoribosylformimino-5-aminoimidazole carboxamide ribotide isomerase